MEVCLFIPRSHRRKYPLSHFLRLQDMIALNGFLIPFREKMPARLNSNWTDVYAHRLISTPTAQKLFCTFFSLVFYTFLPSMSSLTISVLSMPYKLRYKTNIVAVYMTFLMLITVIVIYFMISYMLMIS